MMKKKGKEKPTSHPAHHPLANKYQREKEKAN